MAIKIRVNKAGQTNFYNGRNKATDKEVKQYLRDNINNLPPDLDNKTRKIAGQIKGGLQRAKEAKNARVNGKFVEGDYARAAQRLGIDISEMIKDAGVGSLKELFRKNEGLEEAFTDIMAGVGLPMWFNAKASDNVIKDFTGSTILVNGNEVTKAQARGLLSKTITEINREFAPVDMSLKMEFKGKGLLIIDLPELEYYEGSSENEFAEFYGERFKIYTSSKKEKTG